MSPKTFPPTSAIFPLVQHLRDLWLSLKSSLWFVPVIAVLIAIVLAIVLTSLDLHIGSDWVGGHTIIFGVGAEGARGMLSSIAGSMMTVASLSFSLTISTLATASSQYTSRLIRNFMRDRYNQFVLGYFVGLFAYCLVVLRAIRSSSGDGWQFVPSLAVMTGLVLALISIGVLIFFIHHIAESIQAATILDTVTHETVDAIEEIFPKSVGNPSGDVVEMPDAIRDDQTTWQPVAAEATGYVQHVDASTLLRLATEHDTVVRMASDIGTFVTPAGPLCHVALREPPDDDFAAALREAYSVGSSRTIEQDPAFGVRQIVDIGLKALSPGINDTTTGVMCLEHLGTIVEAIAQREIPDQFRAHDGTLRVNRQGDGRSPRWSSSASTRSASPGRTTWRCSWR